MDTIRIKQSDLPVEIYIDMDITDKIDKSFTIKDDQKREMISINHAGDKIRK